MEFRPVSNPAGFVASVLAAAEIQDRNAYTRLVARAPDGSAGAIHRSSRRNTPGPQARYGFTDHELRVFGSLVARGFTKKAATEAVFRSRLSAPQATR